MSTSQPRVLTIAPGQAFLDCLADSVLSGFPRGGGTAPSALELPRWTILLPTRRAVRELENIFLARSGGKALLLPRIRPIGDIDEDLMVPEADAEDLPDAMAPIGQLLLLTDLIDAWASATPQSRLAQEIAAAPQQAHTLARSLAEFLDRMETEEVDASRIPELYGLESAGHREAILQFLGVAREAYPARLNGLGLMSAKARRSLALRHEANRLRDTMPEMPIIAAGSTGSIPATRQLLQAIAHLPNGAVVLPGLDLGMDDASWAAVAPPHPQHALKQLLAFLGIGRGQVEALAGPGNRPRNWLASEIMRPAETSDAWRDAVASNTAVIADAMAGVELVEAGNVHDEATVIALMLRQSLDTAGRTASLVTPDRNLARRVKAALQRWDIAIDDSGGEPLIRFGGAALLNLVIDAVETDLGPESLAGLLRHPLCRFGETPEAARACASVIELALLRSGEPVPRLGHMADGLRRMWPPDVANPQRHPVLRRITREHWDAAIAHLEKLAAVLLPLTAEASSTLDAWLTRCIAACEAMAGADLWQGASGKPLRATLDDLLRQSPLLQHCGFTRAAAILRHAMTSTILRPPGGQRLRLSILGLLEARLMRPDLVVLGGLNEGTWPGRPDAGPWLNRPMRDTLGMQQPERDIGQTAHDFVQAFGAADVKLVWSRRLDDAPAIPSRWILRLQMLLKSAGLNDRLGKDSDWPRLTSSLNQPAAVIPHAMPQPRPPVAARPKKLSVTRIETLLRDPYAIYARHILDLEPVAPIAGVPDASRKGIIFHGAIGDFLAAYPLALPGHVRDELLRFGARHFEGLRDDPGVYSFWWPRFQRIAAWLAAEESVDRPAIAQVFAEVSGALELIIAGQPFTLSCRADRVDVLKDGRARISDYKTGTVPSNRQVEAGLAPQLTLQAAILEAGGFRGIGPHQVAGLAYVKLGGGDPPGEVKPLKLDGGVMAASQRHIAALMQLLHAYANPQQAYLPRIIVQNEDEALDYDHLSRFREWALAGTAP